MIQNSLKINVFPLFQKTELHLIQKTELHLI